MENKENFSFRYSAQQQKEVEELLRGRKTSLKKKLGVKLYLKTIH